MSAPNASTFDLSPPTRPGTDTFNGIAKIDEPGEEPDPQTMPNADEWNTMEWLILAACRVMPVTIFSVVIASGVASVARIVAAPKDLIAATLTPSRVSAGVVEVTWPADTFPGSSMTPMVSLNSGPGSCWAEPIANGVRIHTYDASGTAADRNTTIQVF